MRSLTMPKNTDNHTDSTPSTPADETLLDQAIALCQQVHENPYDELLLKRVHQWQQQSDAHQTNWRQAQTYWDASAQIKPQFVESGLLNRVHLALQIKADIFQESIKQKWQEWSLRKNRKIWPAPILAACLLLCMVLINPSVFLIFDDKTPELAPVTSITTDYQTLWHDKQTVELSDGTVIHLNWKTRISVIMSTQQRRVVLHSGEAQFKVAPDKTRPFIVEAQGISATAVGTAFVVRHAENNRATITVSEGIVEVNSPAAAPVLLKINQQLSSSVTSMDEVLTVDASNSAAWQQDMLIFQGKPLLDALAELNRYTRLNIEAGFIFDTDRRVTGTYFIDRADDALALIALAFDLELEQRMGKIVVKSARAKRPN